MKIKISLLTLVYLYGFLGLACAQKKNNYSKIKTGIDVLEEQKFKILDGKKVGLITNATGLNSALIPTIDILFNAENVELIALYGPEHGARGEIAAGDKVDDYTDEVTKVPVYSLYNRKNESVLHVMFFLYLFHKKVYRQ